MGKLLWEAIQRSTTGPMMTEEKFETELFPTVLGDLQKKYRIEFDPDEPAMIDPELADAIFEAGKELLLEVGLLCKDTQRIIKFSQEEIEEAILTARHEVTVGHGREAITLSPRAPGDRRSEVKEEGRAKPGPGDMNGAGRPVTSARAVAGTGHGDNEPLE